MPNFKSDLITAKDSANISDKQTDGRKTSGNPFLLVAAYTLLGTETVADTIQLGDIPAGAIIDPGKSFVVCQDPGTTLTVDIGTAADPDGIADGIVLSAGNKVECCSTAIPAYGFAPPDITEQTRVYATVASAGTLTEGAKLLFYIGYRIRN